MLQFYVTTLMAKLTAGAVHQAIRQYDMVFFIFFFSYNIKQIDRSTRTMREIAVIPYGCIQGCTDLRQN